MNSALHSIKKLLLALICICLVSSGSYAESFNDWKGQQQTGFAQANDEFDKYKSKINAAFKEYKRKTGEIWGKDNAELDSKRWVSYIDKLNQRSVVDFERGVVNVEIALPIDESMGDEQANKQLEQALIKAMKLGDDKRPMQQVAAQPISKPSGDNVLAGQISLPDGTVAQQDDYQTLAHIAAAKFTKKPLLGDDGKTRVVYKAQLKLVPDHIRLRASKYQALVNKYAVEHKVPVPLVFAVIETESMFNPTARSGAPAFGLMQLVPTSGARDAYRYVFNKDKVVSDIYLYNPENNIRLGTAYLSQLNSAYLDGIESEESRMLAIIAAYNTGTGNVFKAFAGAYNPATHGNYKNYIAVALYEINRRKPTQVFHKMRLRLPYIETRRYIKKVTDRMTKYGAV